MAAYDNGVRVARVLHEDDKFMTVEIVKDLETPLNVEEGDQYYSIAFIKRTGLTTAKPWLPWEESNDGV